MKEPSLLQQIIIFLLTKEKYLSIKDISSIIDVDKSDINKECKKLREKNIIDFIEEDKNFLYYLC